MSVAHNKGRKEAYLHITDRGAAEWTALTYYSDHLKQTINQEVMFQHVITWCSSRTRDRGETQRMGYESNGQCIVSENDLLVNIKGDTVSLRCK